MIKGSREAGNLPYRSPTIDNGPSFRQLLNTILYESICVREQKLHNNNI